MRLFIAVKFEQNIIDELTSIQNALRTLNFKGRYSSVENLHLTLAFIGEYQNPDDVINAMEKIQCKQFDISLSGYLGNFGNLIWAGMERTPELDSYAKKLRYTLADSNIPFDKKNFNPHITLLRHAQGQQAFSTITVKKESMTVQRISLMRSDFGKHGAVYTEIDSVQLD